MEVLALNSSPRIGGQSKTELMLNHLVQGMRETGAEVDVINLHEKKIEYCIGCYTCWTKTPGRCLHKDDMTTELFPKWLDTDMAVYATPLYNFTLNAEMKAFIERTLPFMEPFFEQRDDRSAHPLRNPPPDAVFLSVAGFIETLSEIQQPVIDFKTFALIGNEFWKTCIAEGVTPKKFRAKNRVLRPDSKCIFRYSAENQTNGGFDQQKAAFIKFPIEYLKIYSVKFMGTPLEKKSSVSTIKKRFDHDVERFANLETGQSAIMDAPLAMELITRAAIASTSRIQRALDIGCGAGNNTLKLCQFVSPIDCDLVDLSSSMLEKARERIAAVNTGKIRILQGDFREIDLPAQGYDIILAAAVLHHLRDDQDWESSYQLDLLRTVGFDRVELLHKNCCFAAFGAIKTPR